MNQKSDSARRAVHAVFQNFLTDADYRPELLHLIQMAEDAGGITWVANLGFHLNGIEPDFSIKKAGETAEEYVRRVIKYLISKNSPKGSALAVEDLLGEFEGLQGEMSMSSALSKAAEFPR